MEQPLEQAEDFRAEAAALAALLEPLSDGDFTHRTQFKGWSVNDVIGHLHLFDRAARLALTDPLAFRDLMTPVMAALERGDSLLLPQRAILGDLAGRALLRAWRAEAEATADAYARADPRQRIPWVGPAMSARSAITARQMETWAHGQELFDLLGVTRRETDRIRNIVHLGVATFGWSFANRGLPVPDPAPHLRLTAPSGAVWKWNPPRKDNAITGTAVDFARVVTQVRNVADTGLTVTGPTARRWMEIAQCFAGPPEDPPRPGTRFMQVS